MPKTISIGEEERFMSRSTDEAMNELTACFTDTTFALRNLSERFPGTVGIAATCGGKARRIVILAPCETGDCYSPLAEERVRTLARMLANFPRDLRDAFVSEFTDIVASEKSPQPVSGRPRAITSNQ